MFVFLIDYFFNQKYNFILNYRTYIGIILTIIFIGFYLFINEKDIKDKYKQILILLMFSLFSIIFIFMIYRNEESCYYKKENITLIKEKTKFNDKNFKESIKQPLSKLFFSFFGYFISVISVVLFISLFFWSINNSNSIFKLIELSLGIILLILFLSTIAYIFKINTENCNSNKFDEMNFFSKLSCFIKKFIFFIPCLFLVFITNVKKELFYTPPIVFILLILQIIIILLFIFIPILYKYLSNFNGNNLLPDGPIYLNNKKTIGKYQQLNKKFKLNKKSSSFIITNPFNEAQSLKYQIGKEEDINLYNYNYTYSIKFNLYINPQEYNTNLSYNKETNLFNYGNKPQILYNGKTKEIIIRTQTKRNEGKQLDFVYKTTDFKYQKWIPFLINYNNNKIDIFINNKLVSTKDNISPYFTDDEIIVGENDGIHGSIDEIYYYDKIQTPDNFESFFKKNEKYENKKFGNIVTDYKNLENNLQNFKRIM